MTLTLPPMAICLILAASAGAQSPTPDHERSVESCRDALSKSTGFPWYDEQADGVRSIEVQPPKPLPRPREWTPSKRTAPKWNGGKWLWTVAKILMGGLLAALVIWLIVMLVRAAMANARDPRAVIDDEDAPQETTDADRIEKLPFPINRSKSDLLGSAERYYREGNFAEAIVYLFSHQLLQLDKHHLIRLSRGKTNRQYLREIQRHQRILDLVRDTMAPFEDVFFGDHSLGRSQFEACWNQLDEFHGLVQQTHA